ncbi:MAG: GspE/PulE family protein [Isosphaeraceae bacterium]
MCALVALSFQQRLASLSPSSARYAVDVIDALLGEARALNASDVHLLPTPEGMESWWRIDGVLQRSGVIPATVAPNVIARLKVLAELTPYRTDIPQEGRIKHPSNLTEMRVSTIPTVLGEKAVVRLFNGVERYIRLSDLGFPDDVQETLRVLLAETSGAILVTGPAGSGKSTTIYTLLREILSMTGGGRSVTTLEDPVEVIIPGAAQSQVNQIVGFDLASGLRSLLRQDPQVIAVGEIRDRETAEIAFQASLTGHLVISTIHAASSAGVLSRLLDMGIEPGALRSGLRAIVSQRLVRRLCTSCCKATEDPKLLLGLPVERANVAVGCSKCQGTGYRGRMVLAELLTPENNMVASAIVARASLEEIEKAAVEAGMVTRWDRALEVVQSGLTDPSEIRRAYGFRDNWEKQAKAR